MNLKDQAKFIEYLMNLARDGSYPQLKAEIISLMQELDFHQERAAYYREEVRYLTTGEEE